MRRTSWVAMGLVGVLLAGAFGAWVWPTPFRSIPLERAPRDVFAARENRFTGAVDVLTPVGWLRLERARAPEVAGDTDALAGYRTDWRGTVPRDTAPRQLRVAPY